MELLILITLFLNLITYSNCALNGKCGYPGKPYKAKLEPDNKLSYAEGEEVTYQCTGFWSYIHVRKCVKGRWSGPPPRCGDYIDSTLMKDVRVEDITAPNAPILKFEHKNMTITNTQWNYPNAFTSFRFKKARLRIFDSNRYKWSFNFTVPVPKLFVGINFNIINYTLQSEEYRNNYTLNVSLWVSPERECVLEHQTIVKWRDNGVRIDCHFLCDSLTYEGFLRDNENPLDYMFLETQTSGDLHHDLVAVLFGKIYGTVNETICGEPETNVGQVSRINTLYREYFIDCKEKVFTTTDNYDAEVAVLGLKCKGDMKWFGSYVECVPIKPCPLSSAMIGSVFNKTIVTSVNGLYYFNDTQYYAFENTEVNFGCDDPTIDVLKGTDNKICLKDGKWSNKAPYCQDPNENIRLTMVLGLLGGTVCIIGVLSALVFYFYNKRSKKQKEQTTNESKKRNSFSEDYDDIDIYDKGKNIYEDYQTVGGDEEVRYADAYYASEPDYVQMPQDVHLPKQSSEDYWKIPEQESDYLEMTDASAPYIKPTYRTRISKL